jgi:hypothetical protein
MLGKTPGWSAMKRRGLLGDGGSIAQGAMHDKNFLSETDAKRLMAFLWRVMGGEARGPMIFRYQKLS